ncbi:hypothetical protein GE09DRAFT_1288618 [Coniochaeta sp. 2T2.1]|nr:hypothetical protein GE09DRAFT_1288618 [Coniochaeta sp. 2T2.1]
MATSSDQPVADSVTDPEAWDQLARHRDRKQACLDDAAKIQDSCPKDPGHKTTPVTDCKHCHRKIIDRISHRYLDSPETEWYADRRTFLQHLAELFPAVKRGEVDASGIEDRVMDEKWKWHRENVRRVAVAMGMLGMPERREELFKLMDDRRLKFGGLCARVKEVIGRGVAPVPEESLERLISARNDPKARVQAYKEIFFFPNGQQGQYQKVDEATRKYLEMVEKGVPMSKVAGMIVEDKRRAIEDVAKLKEHRNRIETLQKAKETWLRKSRDDRVEEPCPPPPCLRCGRQPDVADPVSCAICQLAVAHGIQEEPVVFCSKDCQIRAHGVHVEEAHECASGEHCITLHELDEDEDNDPTNEQGDVYLCKDCLEQRQAVQLYCTRGCVDANFQHHIEEIHYRSDRSKGAGGYDDHRRRSETDEYWRDTEAHFVTLDQALRDLQVQKVVDNLEFLPPLPPAAKPPRPQAVQDDHADEHMDDYHPDDIRHMAETHTHEIDTDGGDDRPAERAPSKLRHSDDPTRADQMEGVETRHTPEPASEPVHNSNDDADTEMMDAVAVADFAAKHEDAEGNPPTAPTEQPSAAKEEDQPAEAAELPPAQEPSPSNKSPEPPKSPVADPTIPSLASDPKPTAMKQPIPGSDPSDLAERPPISDPRAAEKAFQPSTTIASPGRITSIEPMPSLGRSLEVEIAKIPAGSHVRSQLDDSENVPNEEDKVRGRDADVDVMDLIADEKARDIDYRSLGDGTGVKGNEEQKKDDGGLKTGDKKAVEDLLRTPLGDEGEEVKVVRQGDKKTGDGVHEGDGEAGSIPDLPVAQNPEIQEPASQQLEKTTTTTPPKPAQPLMPDQAADSMEEGEISEGPGPSSNHPHNQGHSHNKRKASSVEPGEVQEEPKKPRSNADAAAQEEQQQQQQQQQQRARERERDRDRDRERERDRAY